MIRFPNGVPDTLRDWMAFQIDQAQQYIGAPVAEAESVLPRFIDDWHQVSTEPSRRAQTLEWLGFALASVFPGNQVLRQGATTDVRTFPRDPDLVFNYLRNVVASAFSGAFDAEIKTALARNDAGDQADNISVLFAIYDCIADLAALYAEPLAELCLDLGDAQPPLLDPDQRFARAFDLRYWKEKFDRQIVEAAEVAAVHNDMLRYDRRAHPEHAAQRAAIALLQITEARGLTKEFRNLAKPKIEAELAWAQEQVAELDMGFGPDQIAGKLMGSLRQDPQGHPLDDGSRAMWVKLLVAALDPEQGITYAEDRVAAMGERISNEQSLQELATRAQTKARRNPTFDREFSAEWLSNIEAAHEALPSALQAIGRRYLERALRACREPRPLDEQTFAQRFVSLSTIHFCTLMLVSALESRSARLLAQLAQEIQGIEGLMRAAGRGPSVGDA